MAFHAIKAGEGDVFISAGVETVSRYAKGNADGLPDTQNPLFADAQARTETFAGGGQTWHDPRESGQLPDIYIAMGQTAENVAQLKGITREEQDEFGVRSQNLAEKAIAERLLGARDHAGDAARRHRGQRRRRPARRGHPGGGRRAQAGVPPRRHGDRRQLLPAQRRRRRRGDHVRHQGARARPHAAGPDRRPPASPGCPRRSWASARSRRPGRRSPAPA